MQNIYLDRDQCKKFNCPYFETGETVIAADTLSNSKFYDSEITAGLVMAGQRDLVLERNESEAPGWYRVTVQHSSGNQANASLVAVAQEMLQALREANEVMEIAKRYFPKSIRNANRFTLLNVQENKVRKAIAKATGE